MRCPVCKADNTQGPSCRRCKADLSLLFTLEEQRNAEMDRAEDLLAVREWEGAYESAKRADELRRDEESLRLRAVTALLARDYRTAWECYRALKN